MRKKLIVGVNDLKTLRPDLALEWDYEMNAPIKPENVMSSSSKYANWICSYGHRWSTKICNRSNGKGCPYDAGIKRN